MVQHTYNPTLDRMKQEDCKFSACLSYTERPCLKIKDDEEEEKGEGRGRKTRRMGRRRKGRERGMEGGE